MRSDALRYLLAPDGSSDRILMHHIDWLLRQHTDAAIISQFADMRRLHRASTSVAQRIQQSYAYYDPCDLLFVHRDAEGQGIQKRVDEITTACEKAYPAGAPTPVICVIPVRMQEAWLLFDELAIRSASGNPNGRGAINLPTLKNVESLSDPKSLLHEMLKEASGLRGRRRTAFNAHSAALRVPEYINDFSPLRALPAFRRLEDEIVRVIAENDW